MATRIAHLREATTEGYVLSLESSVYPLAKRVLDVVGASLMLVLLSPLMLLIALAIALDSPGPARALWVRRRRLRLARWPSVKPLACGIATLM